MNTKRLVLTMALNAALFVMPSPVSAGIPVLGIDTPSLIEKALVALSTFELEVTKLKTQAINRRNEFVAHPAREWMKFREVTRTVQGIVDDVLACWIPDRLATRLNIVRGQKLYGVKLCQPGFDFLWGREELRDHRGRTITIGGDLDKLLGFVGTIGTNQRASVARSEKSMKKAFVKLDQRVSERGTSGAQGTRYNAEALAMAGGVALSVNQMIGLELLTESLVFQDELQEEKHRKVLFIEVMKIQAGAH